jgi:hypothetical protein
MKNLFVLIRAALGQCWAASVSIFTMYSLACLTGILMVNSGSEIALHQRDKIVGDAVQTSAASINYIAGNKFTAALHDCAGNLLYAAIPQTLLGLGVIPPFFTAAYQGWIGGIVSVDGARRSRFRDVRSATYYLVVLIMQLIPFSLSIGAGIRCGIDLYKHNRSVSWRIWEYRIPIASLRDLGCVYLVTIPLFFIASCFEFFSAWNI